MITKYENLCVICGKPAQHEEGRKMEEKKISKNHEIWRPVKGFENQYMVSSKGRVKSLPRRNEVNAKDGRTYTSYVKETFMIPCDNGNGYQYVSLALGHGKRKNVYVHKLVAEAFIPNPEGKKCINHKDYNKSNNKLENLEWVTHKENSSYSSEHYKVPRTWKNGGSIYGKGIRKKGNKFELTINKHYIGTFETVEEARKVRDEQFEQHYYKI